MRKIILGSIFVVMLVVAGGFNSIIGTSNAENIQSINNQTTARKLYFGDIVIMFNGNSEESYAIIYPGEVPDPLDLNSETETIIFQVNCSIDMWGWNDWGEVSATVWVDGGNPDTQGYNTNGNWDGTFTWTINCVDGTLIEWYLYAHGHDLFFDKYDDYSDSTTCKWTSPPIEPHANIRGSIRGTVPWDDQPKYCEDEFEICNNGDPGSELYWELYSYPSWGSDWSIDPNFGILRPEDGWMTVSVGFLSPIGELYAEWSDPMVLFTNAPDQEFIDVPCSCVIPTNHMVFLHMFFQHLFERFPHAFPILRYIMGY